ncbi:MAG: hypothetical protein U0835_21760 [Isosphaeraceae bacterium]
MTTPLVGVIRQTESGRFEFRSETFGPRFVGRGPDRVAALRDWQEAVHTAFQRLYHKADFERSEEEENLAGPVPGHRRRGVQASHAGATPGGRPGLGRAPLRGHLGRQAGRPGRARSHAAGVRRAFEQGNGSRRSSCGTPTTWKLLSIRDVQPREQIFRPLSADELKTFWDGLTPTTALPASGVIWGPREDARETGPDSP